MQTESDSARTFTLGLTLSGAVSAGAYTAGVLDFLIQALDAWERAKTPGKPDHRVVIEVIAGASAGAITGGLGVVALSRGLSPTSFAAGGTAGTYACAAGAAPQRWACVLPALWRTWVELPDMIGPAGGPGLLRTDDLAERNKATRPAPPVRSLLDSSALDAIRDDALACPATPVPPPDLPYVSARLHVYMTLTNLRGIPYSVQFGTGSFGMMTHGDRVHYRIADLGSGVAAEPNAWLAADTRGSAIGLSAGSLRQPGAVPRDWCDYGEAALGSGAFPGGLAARMFDFPVASYLGRRLPIDDYTPAGASATQPAIVPDFPPGLRAPDARFRFGDVDGGLVNNSPFDIVQYALFGKHAAPVSDVSPDRAIVMISPFPEPPQMGAAPQTPPGLVATLLALVPVLTQQARFQLSELAPAVSPNDPTRFLISPRRRLPPPAGDGRDERFTIACGLLGGFGGFFDMAFRAHDFQLGRRNCQMFLKNNFTVPAGGVVTGDTLPDGTIPVIPLLGDAAAEVGLPLWPTIDEARFADLMLHVRRRIVAVVPALIEEQASNVYLLLALRFGWYWFLRDRTVRHIAGLIRTDLVRRRQIDGYDLPNAVVRALPPSGGKGPRAEDDIASIVAALIDPNFDYRTQAGLAADLELDRDFVGAVLSALTDTTVPEKLRAWRQGEHWTSWPRRPAWPWRFGATRWLREHFAPPTIG